MCLHAQLQIDFLNIVDESNQHRGDPNGETHFRIELVTANFAGMPRVARFRKIHDLLQTELQTGLHALTLHLFTPEEWVEKKTPLATSPQCASKKK